MEIRVEPITWDAFAPYGEVLESPGAGPRQNFAAAIENLRAGARANLAMIRAEPLANEPVRVMERHSYSNQLFLPLNVDEYIILVAGGQDTAGLDLRTLRAFRVGRYQAINYRSGTWHMGMATLGRPGVFIMFIHEDGSEDDCEYRAVDPILIRRS